MSQLILDNSTFCKPSTNLPHITLLSSISSKYQGVHNEIQLKITLLCLRYADILSINCDGKVCVCYITDMNESSLHSYAAPML